MSYESEEIGIETSKPIELYKFTVGSTEYFYTSAEDSHTYDGDTYTTEQIFREELKQKAGGAPANVNITVPVDNPVGALFVGIPTAAEITVVLYAKQRDEATPIELWSGTLSGGVIRQAGTMVEMKGVAEALGIGHRIPRDVYSAICPYELYSTECGLSAVAPANYYTGNVSSQDGVAITIDGLNAAKGTDFCVSGKLLDEHGEYRQVIAQGGDIVTLNLPLLDDVVGEDVTVWRSCDHSYEDCVALSNGSNFGGFLGIPSRNPFTKGVD